MYTFLDGGCGLEGPNLDWPSGLCLFDAITDVDTLNEQFTFTDTLGRSNLIMYGLTINT
jgi:hypothetical protein